MPTWRPTGSIKARQSILVASSPTSATVGKAALRVRSVSAAKVTSACWHAVSPALRSPAVKAFRSFPCADPPRVHACAARHVMLHIASDSILTATQIMMVTKTPDGACSEPHGAVSGRDGRRHRHARRGPRGSCGTLRTYRYGGVAERPGDGNVQR